MVRKDIKEFIATIPIGVTVVAATKYIDSSDIKELYKNGISNYGENRVNDFLKKYNDLIDLRNNIKWHFIGHLQRNKAKLIIDKIDYLHSLDSLELAKIINDNRSIPLNTFIEISINLEENKNGVPFYEATSFIKEVLKFPNIKIIGLMMMADPNRNDPLNQFHKLKELKSQIEKELNIDIPYLSMGMSNDYREAIKEGATHIRLGRILFDL